ncbi:MAG TPA: NAD(P)-binding domain-containing protein [Vicinamibacterales bacterium]|nr:NAD(P)-binding domain-containing protein [Vicinamibacterales bacterium]
MRQVAIIGAGELGGAIAHLLARRDVARSIVIVDERDQVAAGKALDIAQAAPVEGFATQLSASGDVSSAAGADVIVVAERVQGGEWTGEDAFALVRRLTASAPAAVVVLAGLTSRDTIERSVREGKVAAPRLIGSAPEALAAAARAITALAINGSPRDVALSVLGVPPAHTVVAWEDATVGGFALTRVIDGPTRRRLAAKIQAMWPPGPHALAAAAVKTIAAIDGQSRQLVTAFVAPDPTMGLRARTAALPVRLSASGVVEVATPSLSVVERNALDNAMML